MAVELPANNIPYTNPNHDPLKIQFRLSNIKARGDLPEALVHETWRGIPLCDYASAGNLMCAENPLTVWFPAVKASK